MGIDLANTNNGAIKMSKYQSMSFLSKSEVATERELSLSVNVSGVISTHTDLTSGMRSVVKDANAIRCSASISDRVVKLEPYNKPNTKVNKYIAVSLGSIAKELKMRHAYKVVREGDCFYIDLTEQ